MVTLDHPPAAARPSLTERIARWARSHRHFLIFAGSIALTAAVHEWGTTNYWLSLGILAAGAAGVHAIPNVP